MKLNGFGKFWLFTMFMVVIAALSCAFANANPKASFTLPTKDGQRQTFNLGWGHCAPFYSGCVCPDGTACATNGVWVCCSSSLKTQPKAQFETKPLAPALAPRR